MKACPSSPGLASAVDLMRESGVEYWLDSGALLGLVREGAELAWDSDIDFAIWEEAVPAFHRWIATLSPRGFRTSLRRYRGRIYGFTVTRGNLTGARPLHIHVYFHGEGFAWSPQTVVMQPPPPSRAAGQYGQTFLNRMLLRSQSIYKNRAQLGGGSKIMAWLIHIPIWAIFVIPRNRLERQHWSVIWPFSVLYTTHTWVVPAEFFAAIVDLDTPLGTVPVPRQTEAYLSARYGDWKIPRQDWCYWMDDGCLHAGPPEIVLHDRALPTPSHG